MTPDEIAALNEEELSYNISTLIEKHSWGRRKWKWWCAIRLLGEKDIVWATQSWNRTMDLVWKYKIGFGPSNIPGLWVAYTTYMKLDEKWRDLAFPTAKIQQELRIAICRLALVCAVEERRIRYEVATN